MNKGMNESCHTGLGNDDILRLLHFNSVLKTGSISLTAKQLGIDVYCDLLSVVHPECNL